MELTHLGTAYLKAKRSPGIGEEFKPHCSGAVAKGGHVGGQAAKGSKEV